MAARSVVAYHAPPLVVRRQRLTSRLHEMVHRRLTLVVAPAGYGKTTLLADFADECAAADLPLVICRYTAAPWDVEAALMLGGIARAIRERFPSFGTRTLRLLEDMRAATRVATGENDPLVTSLLEVLVDELREHVLDYSLLVVDDYHLLDEQPGARRALEMLITHAPPHLHVALLSRTLPALDTSRLSLADEVVAMGPHDLAFTAEELGAFLSQRYGLTPEAGVIEEVVRHTEGWIAGVVFAMPGGTEEPAARTARLLSTLTAWRGGTRLHEYLTRQLFERQSPDDKDLLLAAALPDVCDAGDLDEVLGCINAGVALARLGHSGVPLVPVTEGPGGNEPLDPSAGGRYRMHGLLQQFLRTHLARTDRRRYDWLRRRWGERAEAHGDVAAAMDHYLAARLYEQAARLLERIGERWVDSGRRQLIAQWLERLPPEFIAKRPRLGLCSARLCIVQGQRALALERARAAGYTAQRQRDSVAAARALLLEAMATLAVGRTEEALHLCRQALEQRIVRRNKPLLAEAYRSLSIAENIHGLPALALEHMQRALTLYEHTGQRWDVALALNNLGVAHEQLGHPDEARRCHERSLALCRDLGDLAGVARSLNNLGLSHFYRGALGEAERKFQEAIALLTHGGDYRAKAARYVNFGDLRRAQERRGEALECYREAREAAQAANDPRWHGYALMGEASAHLAQGEIATVEQVARQALSIAQEAQLLEVASQARIVLAAVALDAGRRREAGALLEAARQAARETGSKTLQVQAYLWSGQLAYEQRRWGEAQACVEVAATAAAALGGPTLLALEGPALVPLLRLAASQGVATELLTRAIDQVDSAAAAALREAASPPPATAALPSVELRLFGGFAGTMGGKPIVAEAVSRSRVRELLAYLALHPAGRRREEIGADLWPDAAPGQDVTLTHTTLHRLRQALFPELVPSDAGNASGTGLYRINPDVQLALDVHRFEDALAAAESPSCAPEARRALLVQAIAAYGGPFFPECYADWAGAVRRRLERRYVTALAQLVDATWATGDYRACLKWCLRLLEEEPAEETVHCRALECYERLGEPLAGILHFRRYAGEARELGAEPFVRARTIVSRLQTLLAAPEPSPMAPAHLG